MSESKKSMWDYAFGAVGAVAPKIDTFAKSEDVATMVALQQRINRGLGKQLQKSSSQFLHAFNLPAGTDVSRLLRQIGELEREVRNLKKQLADAEPSTLSAVTDEEAA